MEVDPSDSSTCRGAAGSPPNTSRYSVLRLVGQKGSEPILNDLVSGDPAQAMGTECTFARSSTRDFDADAIIVADFICSAMIRIMLRRLVRPIPCSWTQTAFGI